MAMCRAPKLSEANKDAKVDPKDVKLLREQTGCSEEKAIAALQAADGDLINASELTLLFSCTMHEEDRCDRREDGAYL